MKLRFTLTMAMALAIAGCDAFSGVSLDANKPSTGTGGLLLEGTPCVPKIWYFDGDGDGYGVSNDFESTCEPSSRHVAQSGDCNDSAASVHPGAAESCDNIDNDCNGKVDDTTKSWYYDDDEDGRGDPTSEIKSACNGMSPKYVANGEDCNDHAKNIYKGAKEDCDNVDNNCNGEVDEGAKSVFHPDVDGDGHGDPKKPPVLACAPSKEAVVLNDDCDDADAKNFPGNTEVCDGKDNTCDSKTDEGKLLTFYKDSDGDGHGDLKQTVEACDAPAGTTTTSDDCNDDLNTGKNIHPGAAETCNNVDENCDGVTDEGVKTTFFVDGDGDGHGSLLATWETCNPGINPKTGDAFVASFDDCDDTDPTVHPGASEVCDGKINDCKAQKLVEPNSLCPAMPFKEATCGGVNKCQYEDEKLLMTCSNPESLKESDGYSCGVAYYYGDALADKKIVMTFEKAASSPLMAEVCAELKKGKTLHVSVFVQIDFDTKFIWVNTSFMKLIDSFTNVEIKMKNPGNVVVGDSVEFDLKLEDVPACQ